MTACNGDALSQYNKHTASCSHWLVVTQPMSSFGQQMLAPQLIDVASFLKLHWRLASFERICDPFYDVT
eukprot:6050014-Amphidinium_carterae.1